LPHPPADPATPFFSYVYDLSQPPSNVIELAALTMWQGLGSLFGVGAGAAAAGQAALCAAQGAAAQGPWLSPHPPGQAAAGAAAQGLPAPWPYTDVTHVEWWAHTRGAGSTGHQLHFDLDETRLRKVRWGEGHRDSVG